jgi:hypothetical protein
MDQKTQPILWAEQNHQLVHLWVHSNPLWEFIKLAMLILELVKNEELMCS